MNEFYEDDQDLEASKSQKKRDAHALQDMGERLVTLSDKQLKEVNLPENLQAAVIQAKSITARGALKRQLQYIGKLMRLVDTTPIEEYFVRLDNQFKDSNRYFHKLENMRDKILQEGDAAITDLKNDFPQLDLQHLRQLVRNANNTKNEKVSTKAKREIFQYLKEITSVK